MTHWRIGLDSRQRRRKSDDARGVDHGIGEKRKAAAQPTRALVDRLAWEPTPFLTDTLTPAKRLHA